MTCLLFIMEHISPLSSDKCKACTRNRLVTIIFTVESTLRCKVVGYRSLCISSVLTEVTAGVIMKSLHKRAAALSVTVRIALGEHTIKFIFGALHCRTQRIERPRRKKYRDSENNGAVGSALALFNLLLKSWFAY